MTKLSIFLSLVLLSACASTRTLRNTTSFTFDAIKQVFANNPSQKQILKNYGEPDVKNNDGNMENWRYFDPVSRFDRVRFVFNEEKELVQLMWIPLPGEKELKIERIFEEYPTDYFKVTNRSRTSNHSLKTDTTYSGESVAIFRDDAAKKVNAVAWFTSMSKSSNAQSPMTSR